VLLRAALQSEQVARLWQMTHTYLSGHVMLSRSDSYASAMQSDFSDVRIAEVFEALSPPLDENALENGLRLILKAFGA
jgi:hypothetical protein